MTIPKCRICGAELEIDDVYDFGYDDDSVELKVFGYCNTCEKSFQFEQVGTISNWEINHLREC